MSVRRYIHDSERYFRGIVFPSSGSIPCPSPMNQSSEQCLITLSMIVCARSIRRLVPSLKYMTRSFLKPVYIHRPNSHPHVHPSSLTLLSWVLASNKSRFKNKTKKTRTRKGIIYGFKNQKTKREHGHLVSPNIAVDNVFSRPMNQQGNLINAEFSFIRH